ncbi:thymidylate synthase [Zymomonas mobilis]|uniref:Thymidylate synthase n=1 Tax=Zymomonas mobilis subsp. pomaceae (strain ATCC 29192 / DSM 22645 / JCM 10191 / CCUG 17912 / NBRC 13757 / NCIMB 11200 / NRRL B-4491 / Barker I) TaxID=579138 RepID=F8EV38_ZYMMT|nr:thymidylate synthase [Zymomonas mobilis]AEI38256.1 thymidylate synthase [Zymomonas mobilis subsp. pomaceae ATCC 29192]MDX5947945.1 thymidylate synthase [Zymomonas mobilis subsp. pomaceae]GEB89274.1 thymidylate synthase [Zymomonas mobilis subsp. pomaceae]
MSEHQYLNLVSDILNKGDRRCDRTGIGTLSLFGAMMRFDLSQGQIPILTTKKLAYRLAIREMLWFLSGETNIRPLVLQGVSIWTDWPLARYKNETGENLSKKDFEQRIIEDETFARQWGDLGPVYGKQWRRWQGSDGKEYDQIATIIESLKYNPTSRRMLFHGWNVADLKDMALPPCHMVYQYHVTSDGRLNSLLYQRSADVFLGLPFNLVGASILQAMLAEQAGLALGDLVWTGGDVHIYLNHRDQLKEQLTRTPRSFPSLRFLRHPDSISEYQLEDFIVEGYNPHPPIKGTVAV